MRLPPSRPRIALGGLFAAFMAFGAGPADDLLKLTPPQSAATLAVESLRNRVHTILGSRQFASLQRTSAVRQWVASPWFRNLRTSAEQIERTLGLPLSTVRDQILGEAAVLAYFPGPVAQPKDSRGLLLIKNHNRTLVEGLFGAVNNAQLQSGEIVRIERRRRGTIDYAVRVHQRRSKPDECYAHIDGSTFAWSNSEAVLLNVIDLKLTGGSSLADDEAFAKVRHGLSDDAMASLFLAPEMIDRLKAGSPAASSSLGRAIGMAVDHYTGALEFVGVGLKLGDELSLHVHEALEPEKLDPALRLWLGRPPLASPFPSQVPGTAMAVAAANIDLGVLHEVAARRLGKSDLVRLGNVRELARGMLQGLDPITDIFPRLNRGFFTFVDTQPQADRQLLFPIVGVFGWSESPGLLPVLSGKIDVALKTFLALRAVMLGDQPNMAELRVEPLDVAESNLTVLTNGWRNLFAYRIVNDRLILGNSADSVRRFGGEQPPPLIQEIRSRHFPRAETFAIFDLRRLVLEVAKYRGPIAQQLAAGSKRDQAGIDRDLDQLLSLVGLFRAAAFASEVVQGGSEVHRKLLLLAR